MRHAINTLTVTAGHNVLHRRRRSSPAQWVWLLLSLIMSAIVTVGAARYHWFTNTIWLIRQYIGITYIR